MILWKLSLVLSYTTSQGILVEPGHRKRLTLSEGRFFFPLESQIRDILFGPFKWKLVKRCWSCWTRRTTTGSTQKEFLYRREHSLNGRCWIIQVLNYSQKYLGAELFSELFRCWIILRNILKPVWSRFNTSPLLDSVWKPLNSVELIQYHINLLVFQN